MSNATLSQTLQRQHNNPPLSLFPKQVTDIIVGYHGPDVPDSGVPPPSDESSTNSKPLRYYTKFSQLEDGKKYKFFNRDLMDTSIINNLPFNSYVGTVDNFDIHQKLDNQKLDKSLNHDYTSNRVYKWSGVDDLFKGYIISGKLAKNHLDDFSIDNNTINDDDIYAYGEYNKNVENKGNKYRMLFRVYGINPLISQIYSAVTGMFTRKKTGGKRKRRTHRRRRSNRRRRS